MVRQTEPKRAYSLAEFAKMFSICRDTAARAAKRGDLRTVQLGGRRLVPRAEVERVEKEGIDRGLRGFRPQGHVDGKSLGSGERADEQTA